MVRGVVGSNRLTEKRARFAALVARGASVTQASREAGVHCKTGTRWLFGRTITNTAGEPVHYAPVGLPDLPARPRYLSLPERTLIADLHGQGWTMTAIAEHLGRATSTISRELARNLDVQSATYLPRTAERLALARRPRPRARRLAADTELRRAVRELLDQRWSPEQIAHELRAVFPGEPARRVCAETIYQAIYDPRVPVERPARRRRRRPRRVVQGAQRRGRLPNMTMIAERPLEVEDRVQFGHWEGDTIKGAGGRSAIATLVERRSRFLILVHLPDGRATASAVSAGIIAALAPLPAPLRRTLTWDQGSELAQHQRITDTLGTAVYFCDPHSPWQRGSNENMNGLLRDYFPKGSDLRLATDEDLRRVADEVNRRPRKSLDWARPAHLLRDALIADTA